LVGRTMAEAFLTRVVLWCLVLEGTVWHIIGEEREDDEGDMGQGQGDEVEPQEEQQEEEGRAVEEEVDEEDEEQEEAEEGAEERPLYSGGEAMKRLLSLKSPWTRVLGPAL
jgi:flagellar biosynthesis/type III secretory pathway M-ring protein FliF/YscJ